MKATIRKQVVRTCQGCGEKRKKHSTYREARGGVSREAHKMVEKGKAKSLGEATRLIIEKAKAGEIDMPFVERVFPYCVDCDAERTKERRKAKKLVARKPKSVTKAPTTRKVAKTVAKATAAKRRSA